MVRATSFFVSINDTEKKVEEFTANQREKTRIGKQEKAD